MNNVVLIHSAIVASIGLFASVSSASISHYLTKKHQFAMEERRIKEEYYKYFIKALSDVALNNKDDEALKRLSEGFNSLILFADSSVVEKLMDFRNFIEKKNQTRNTEEWVKKQDALLTSLIKEIRIDLYNKEEKSFPQIHLTGTGKK